MQLRVVKTALFQLIAGHIRTFYKPVKVFSSFRHFVKRKTSAWKNQLSKPEILNSKHLRLSIVPMEPKQVCVHPRATDALSIRVSVLASHQHICSGQENTETSCNCSHKSMLQLFLGKLTRMSYSTQNSSQLWGIYASLEIFIQSKV